MVALMAIKVGDRFGRMTVMEVRSGKYPSGHYKKICICRCDCGETKIVDARNLLSKHVQSCGCLNSELSAARKYRGPNEVRFADGYAYLSLENGREAIIDAEDYPKIKGMRWTAGGNGYVSHRNIKSGISIQLHHLILGMDSGNEIDHIDGNALNNTKGNLRVVDHSDNMGNLFVSRRNKIGYKGVCFSKKGKPGNEWCMQIMVRGQRKRSYYASPIEAARAYDAAAIEMRGENACLNFPEEHPEHKNRRVGRRFK